MKGAQWLLIGVVILVASVGVVGVASSGDVKIEEQVAGPAKAGGVYAVSPRGAHVAYAATKGSRLVVAVDGVEGPVFDELFEPHGGGFFAPQQLSVLPAGSGGLNASTVTVIAGCITNLEDGLSTGGVRKLGPKTSRLGLS